MRFCGVYWMCCPDFGRLRAVMVVFIVFFVVGKAAKVAEIRGLGQCGGWWCFVAGFVKMAEIRGFRDE